MSDQKPAERALPPLDPAQRYSTEEAAAYLRTSRKSLWVQAARGELKVIRWGRRVFVPGTEIARLSRLPPEAAPAAVGKVPTID